MGLLRSFEQRLEGAFEGLFARVFRSGVQPVELGKRLVRAIEDGRTVGVNRLYVPNVYTFELSPGDRERFADYEEALGSELAALAVKTARDNDWAMLGPARVEFRTDEQLGEGRFHVTGTVEQASAAAAVPQQPAAAGPYTAMLPGESRRAAPRALASLVLLSGRHELQAFPLSKPEMSIGRADQCDISLADPGISRKHARVLQEGDDFIIEDLGSTNGTEVNGRPVRRRRLADGDMVRLANMNLQFRREG